MVGLVAASLVLAASQPSPFPVPRSDERLAAYADRWDAWLDETPREQRAYFEVRRLYDEFRRLSADEDFRPRESPDAWPEEFGQTLTFVRRNGAFLADLRAAPLGPVMGFSIEGEPEARPGESGLPAGQQPGARSQRPRIVIEVTLPHFGQAGPLARLLVADAWRAAAAGDAAVVAADVRQALRFASYLHEPPTPPGLIAASRIRGAAARAVLAMDLSAVGGDDGLSALDAVLALQDGSVQRASRFAVWGCSDAVAWIFEDASKEGWITAWGVKRWHEIHRMTAWDADPFGFVARALGTATLAEHQRLIVSLFDAMETDLLVPRWEVRSSVFAERLGAIDPSRFGPLLTVISSVNPVELYARMTGEEQWVIAARLRIAAERHRLRHGAYPETVGAIDPAVLPFDPVDLHTGLPMSYRLTASGPLIYSSGPDRDDDGGVKQAEKQVWLTLDGLREAMTSDPRSIDGDIIYTGQ